MLLFGIVLIALAAAAIVAANRRVAVRHAMIGASTSEVADLAVEQEALVDLGTVGGFSRVAAVVGYAHPVEEGPLRSPQTGTECVWWRRVVRTPYGHEGGGQTVHEEASDRPFVLVEETGNITVDPRRTVPVQPEKVAEVSSFDPAYGGLVREEWVLRPGAEVYVHGEVHDREGALTIGAPAAGAFVVSTRTPTALREDSLLLQRRWAWGGAVSGAAGLALVVAALVT
ncbi:GIDE domain-containing protein [Actinomycetospora chiangmaiensis]|uniref:GIDE domain-containing protein n=1 Tax=Actinomycetospora chiangmaiensis TaxID=402650 RepID=UPI00035D0C96|nr:GIDE domain-containing protein [Actinomycetospora chiangmaiensis]